MTTPKVEITAMWPPASPSAEAAKAMLDVLGPMLEAYWLEARSNPSWAFELDVETFIPAWQARVFVPILVKLDGEPVAFSIMSIAQMLLSKSVKDSEVMTVYVKPEHRDKGLVEAGREYVKQIAATIGVARVVSVPQEAYIVHYEG